jgi:hypothetical protein
MAGNTPSGMQPFLPKMHGVLKEIPKIFKKMPVKSL